jgi:NAD-dependent SIR2 family protein deacetylase
VLSIAPTDVVFILTGAGVSAESGIPTFRGVGGLWRNYRIEEVASPHAWTRDPRAVWEKSNGINVGQKGFSDWHPKLACFKPTRKSVDVAKTHVQQ